MNQPRVCFVRHGYFPRDVRVFKQARTLQKAGFLVDIVCLRDEGQMSSESIDGINIYRATATHRRGSVATYVFQYVISFLLIAIKITRLNMFHRYHIVQVVTMPDFLVFSAIIPKIFGTKVLLDMQEPIPELWMTKFEEPDPLITKLLMLIEKISIKFADRVVTVNSTIRKRFIERGAPGWKIGLSPNVPDETVIQMQLKKGKIGRYTIMTHGTIEEHYGHRIVIEAMRILNRKNSGIQLLIIGDGKYKERLKELVKKYNLENCVSFRGWLPYNEIPNLITDTDIGIVSRTASPFAPLCQPLKLYDYVALKTPVIATRFQAIEESFDDDCIRFVEPDDPEGLAAAIIELRSEPEKAKKLADNAYKRYQESLCWSKSSLLYLRSVMELMNENKGCQTMLENAFQENCINLTFF